MALISKGADLVYRKNALLTAVIDGCCSEPAISNEPVGVWRSSSPAVLSCSRYRRHLLLEKSMNCSVEPFEDGRNRNVSAFCADRAKFSLRIPRDSVAA